MKKKSTVKEQFVKARLESLWYTDNLGDSTINSCDLRFYPQSV